MAKYVLKWYAEQVKKVIEESAAKALVYCGNNLKKESLEQVPWATGDLGGSCEVSSPQKRWNKILVTVGYDTPYAIKQHEDLTLRHPDPRNPLSVPGRKAKYLEDPFNANKRRYSNYIRNSVKRALKRG